MLVNPNTFTLAGSDNSKVYCSKLEHLTITDGTNVIQQGYCNPYLVVETQGNFYIKSNKSNVEVTVSSSGTSTSATAQVLKAIDIKAKATANPTQTFTAIWKELNKPIWYIGNNVFIDSAGAVLTL